MCGPARVFDICLPTGVVLDPDRRSANHVAAAIDQARRAYDAGVRQLWIAQQFDHDAISLAGYVGAAVPDLAVGTFVVPINPRHPLVVASQAQTAQAAGATDIVLSPLVRTGIAALEPIWDVASAL